MKGNDWWDKLINYIKFKNFFALIILGILLITLIVKIIIENLF